MPEVFVGPLDRIDLSVSNALAGNFEGAGRSLYSPDSLSPEERQLIAERFFGAKDPGPMKSVLNLTTNPTVILGAILASKYPVDLHRSYATDNAQFEKGLRRLIPAYDHIADFGEIYRGTPLPKLLYKLGERVHTYHTEANGLLSQAIADYMKENGGKGPSKLSEQRVVYERLRREGSLSAQLEELAKRTEKFDPKVASKLRERASDLPVLNLTKAEQALDAGWGRFYEHALKTSGVDQVDGISDVFLRKAFDGGPRIPGGHRNPADYWPMITKWDAASAKEMQDIFIKQLSEGGKKISGFRMSGPDGKALTPSEMFRMVEDFHAQYNGPIGGSEMETAFKQFIRDQEVNQITGAAAKVASGTQAKRLNRMVPMYSDLAGVSDDLKPLANSMEEAIKTLHGNSVTDVPRPYRLDGTPTARIYSSMRARDYGWSVVPEGWDRTVGERMNDTIRELKEGARKDLEGNIVEAEVSRTKNWIAGATLQGAKTKGGNQAIRVAMWNDTFLPQIMGTMTYDETISSAWWDSMRVSAADKLSVVRDGAGNVDRAASGRLGLALEELGAGKMREAMVQGILNDSRFSQKAVNQAVAGYFYQSTLALPNIMSPVKNLFQTLTATAPRIGLKHTTKGITETLQRASQFIDLKMQGVAHDEAFARAFPGFRETGLAMDEGLLRAMDRIHAGFGPGVKGPSAALRKAKQLSMSLFSGSEITNRLIAYYGSRSALTDMYRKVADLGKEVDYFPTGEKILLPKVKETFFADKRVEELIHAGATAIVHDTQGGGGIATVPAVLAKIPPMFRQLMQFPIRYASQLLHGGAGEMGRALIAGGVAAAALGAIFGASGKKLAADATLFGSMPMPSDQGPFAPWPLVPPVLQLGGSALQALATGDAGNLQRSLPLLVPGGVGLSRLAAVSGQAEIARMIGKPVADYEHKTPDGRIPMMGPRGDLIGFYTPTQLFAKSIGLGDVNADQELALNKWMEKYGQRITDMRSQFLDAMANNDIRKASSIRSEYRRLNPGIGELPVTTQQINAIAARRNVSRFERQLEGLQPDLRPQFAAVAGVSFGQSGSEFLGVPVTALMDQSTIRARNPYRMQPPRQDMLQTNMQNGAY